MVFYVFIFPSLLDLQGGKNIRVRDSLCLVIGHISPGSLEKCWEKDMLSLTWANSGPHSSSRFNPPTLILTPSHSVPPVRPCPLSLPDSLAYLFMPLTVCLILCLVCEKTK